eukprot:260757_1
MLPIDLPWERLLHLLIPSDYRSAALACKSYRDSASSHLNAYLRDISRGQASYLIPCLGKPNDWPPFDTYCTDNVIYGEEDNVMFVGCECDAGGDCSGVECSCAVLSASADSNFDQQHLSHKSRFPHGSFECHSGCPCDPARCHFRDSQASIAHVGLGRTLTGAGWGVFALNDIACNTFICLYTGEIISTEEVKNRRVTYESNNWGNYILSICESIKGCDDRWIHIDATRMGSIARFMNHSCLPNIALQCIYAGSVFPRVALFAVRDISAGEELAFSYGDGRRSMTTTHRDGRIIHPPNLSKCYCGEPCCCKVLPYDISAS